MRRPRWMAVAALVPAIALTVAACGGGGGDEPGGSGSNAEISVGGTEPENELVPGNTSESGGGKIVDSLWTGLITYNAEDAAPQNAHAEKIELNDAGDQITFTLKKDWKFHDGTPITADSYIDAWNYVAYSPNGYQLASFFEQIDGFSDVNTPDPDADGPKKAPTPKAKEMSGLKKVDDHTFTVTFTEPHPVFQNKVGYSAFMPMPKAFFDDPEAFAKKPVGSGPFQFVSREAGKNVVLERYDDYKGPDKPQIKTVRYEFGDLEALYKDVQDNKLDFTDTLPPVALAGNVWKQDLEGRSNAQLSLAIQAITFPLYDKKFQNVKFRQAISLAINRQQITDKIFEKTRKPVKGYGVPNLPLWTDGACGDLCDHDPARAKKLFDESGYEGKIELTSNADGGHKEWITAACGQIEKALGTECKFVPVQDFGIIREKINAQEMTQVYRAGWQADFPHVENFLNPLYRTGGSSNDGGFSDKAVDAKLAEADKATNEEDAAKLYHEAEELIAQQMPSIPLWDTPAVYGWSDRLENVQVSALTGELDLTSVTVAAD
jgi:oligopeptide transport system substrate-binding protein